MQQLDANFFPRNCTRRIGLVRLRAPPKLLNLRVRQRYGWRSFDRDAVPDVFDELDTLGDRQIVEIAGWSAHEDSISLTTGRQVAASAAYTLQFRTLDGPAVVGLR
jgi:hypothetical protein